MNLRLNLFRLRCTLNSRMAWMWTCVAIVILSLPLTILIRAWEVALEQAHDPQRDLNTFSQWLGFGTLRRIDDFGFWLNVGMAIACARFALVIADVGSRRPLPRKWCISGWIFFILSFGLCGAIYGLDTHANYGGWRWSQTPTWVPQLILNQHDVLWHSYRSATTDGDNDRDGAPWTPPHADAAQLYEHYLTIRREWELGGRGLFMDAELSINEQIDLITETEPLDHDALCSRLGSHDRVERLIYLIHAFRELRSPSNIGCALHGTPLLQDKALNDTFRTWRSRQSLNQWRDKRSQFEVVRGISEPILNIVLRLAWLWVCTIALWTIPVMTTPDFLQPQQEDAIERFANACVSIWQTFLVITLMLAASLSALALSQTLETVQKWLADALQAVSGWGVAGINVGGYSLLGRLIVYQMPMLVVLIALLCSLRRVRLGLGFDPFAGGLVFKGRNRRS